MQQLLAWPLAQLVLWLAVLSILMLVGYYLLRSLRDHSGQDQVSASQLMTNFREMHQQGDISDKEYRTIKTVLGARLQKELNQRDSEG